MVFQEQSLLTNLTVGENIYLGNEAQFTRFGLVAGARSTPPPRASSPRSGSTSTRAARAAELDFATRQMVELAKALTLEEHAQRPSRHPARRADLGARARRDRHPVRAGPGAEGARLLRLRLAPARRGAGALRPGLRHEGRRRGGRAPGGRGRRAHAAPADGRARASRPSTIASPAAAVRPERGPGRGRGLGLAAPTATSTSTLHAGEILGIAGVIGSGREELCRTLAGFAPHDAGTLSSTGREVALASPARGGRPRHRLHPARAARRGLVLFLPVAANITLASLGELARAWA